MQGKAKPNQKPIKMNQRSVWEVMLRRPEVDYFGRVPSPRVKERMLVLG